MNDQSVVDKAAACPRCETTAKLRPRMFSDQALSALVAWSELETSAVGQNICDGCYNELREVLIDREDELSSYGLGKTAPAAAPKEVSANSKSAASQASRERSGTAKESASGSAAKGSKNRGVKIAG